MSNLLQVVKAAKVVDAVRRKPEDIEQVTFFGSEDIWHFIPVWDERLCDKCLEHARNEYYLGTHLRRTFKYLEIINENTIEANVHPHCVKPKTLIQTVRGRIPIENVQLGDLVLTHRGRFRPVIQLHKNWFDGELCKVGSECLTENHPILTCKGWVPPNRFNSVGERLFYFHSPYMESNNTPARFDKKDAFLLVLFDFLLRCVPVTAVNFNSELAFRNGEVDIENIYRVLRNNFDSSFLEAFEEKLFKCGHSRASLPPTRALKQIRPRFQFASNRSMSCFNLMLPLLRSHPSPFKQLSLALSSACDPGFNKSLSYYPSANPVSFGERIFRDSLFDIESNNFVNRKIFPTGAMLPHYHTSTITHIDKEPYKGYVHNLSVSEDESYTIGNRGLVVHNCRCFLTRVTDPVEYLRVSALIWEYA